MKALVGSFNQEKALVGAFSVIVQPVVEPMEHYTALVDIVAESGGWDYYITHSEPGPGDNLFINKFISMNNCSSNGASSQ